MSLSNVKTVKVHSYLCASNVGSVVECSPATRAARVRFPDVAAITFFNLTSAFYFPTHKQIFYHKILVGDAGYRSPYLSHAKRALYHLSYIPCVGEDVINKNLLPLVSTLQSCVIIFKSVDRLLFIVLSLIKRTFLFLIALFFSV